MTNTSRGVDRLISYAVLTVIAVILVLPFTYMISISLSSDKTVAENAFTLLPQEWVVQNFINIFSRSQVGAYFLNSLKICVFAVIGQVFVSCFVAYGFARFRAPGKNVLFLVLLATMMIPAEVTMIPSS